MADNSTDFTKKILVDVELKSEQLKKDLPTLVQEIDKLTESQKAAQRAGETSTQAYLTNASTLRNLKSELRDTNKYIDNVSKALNAETGSIQQNRAILSVATADYVKLGQVEGQVSETTKAMGANINDLTTKLKAQEKEIGQTYRNVGNYEDSLKSLISTMGGGIPVFQQFQQGLTQVKGFMEFAQKGGQAGATGFMNMFSGGPKASASTGGGAGNAGETAAATMGYKQFTAASKEATAAAEETEVATEAAAGGEVAAGAGAETAAAGVGILTAAFTAVLAVVGVVIGVLIALKNYLADIAPVSDKLSDVWAGMKASFQSMTNSIRDGDFANLASNMSDADKKARELNQDVIELNRNMLISDAATAKENAFINTQMLKLRNIHTTADQATEIFNGVQKTAEAQYQRTWHLAFDGYRAYAGQVINAAGLTQKEYDKLLAGGTAYAEKIKRDGGSVTDDLIKKLNEYQIAMSNAQGIRDQIDQRAQNRDDQKQAKLQAASQAAAEKQQKAEQIKEKKAAAVVEVENLRKQALSKQLEDIYDNYGKQAIAADQAYSDEQAKLEKFLAKKLITQAEYNRVLQALTAEHNAAISKIITDFRKNDQDAYDKASQELLSLTLANMHDVTARSIAELQNRAAQQKAETDKQNEAILLDLSKLQIAMRQMKGSELVEAQAHETALLNLIKLNDAKQIQEAQATQDAIDKIKRDAQHKSGQAVLQANVIKDKGTTNVFNSGQAEADEKAQITDQYDFEISEAQKAGESIVLLEAQKQEALKAIRDKYKNQQIEYAVQAEQLVQSGISAILSQGIQQRQQATINALEKSKAAELENTSLTSTQKKLINQKYDAAEKAAKIKAFKADQKLQAANIIINGAVAISKTIAEMGFVPSIPFIALTAAETALSLAKVLSAKPGFASGGVFNSDGKGAVLPGYSRSDNTNARLRSGEAVVVSEAMRVPWARNHVSRINEMFGGRSFATTGPKPAFADGGIFTDGGNANRYYAQPVYSGEGLANSLAYQLINNFPPVFVDVKDINNQQGILAQTTNRVVL